MILLLVCGTLLLAYGMLVIRYWWTWQRIPLYRASPAAPRLKVSVIIPARNEEKMIGRLLQALQQQDYPVQLTELIVVDDHSTDETARIVSGFPAVQLIRLQEDGLNAYKKKAIDTGIARASGELILCTDADTEPGPGWISTMISFAVEKKAAFVAAPVLMKGRNNLLNVFQSLDFMMLQAITGAVVQQKTLTMCNGANLAYTKEAFRAVGGFSGIDDIASGDDMLLMYKIWQRYPQQVHYLKSRDAIVVTAPQDNWRAFIRQRIRWASKAGHYQDKRFLPVLLLVYSVNLIFGVLAVLAVCCAGWWKWLLLAWLVKTLAEWPLMHAAARFFQQMPLLIWFFFLQPLHILYTIFSGFLGQTGAYEWKGRKVR